MAKLTRHLVHAHLNQLALRRVMIRLETRGAVRVAECVQRNAFLQPSLFDCPCESLTQIVDSPVCGA